MREMETNIMKKAHSNLVQLIRGQMYDEFKEEMMQQLESFKTVDQEEREQNAKRIDLLESQHSNL